MKSIEIRELDLARRYVLEGLWLQRVVKPLPATVRPALEWALEIASSGHPLPPTGFVADVGHVAFGGDEEHRAKDLPHIPGWPAALGRTYEDHLLGKLYSDWLFERASDALRRYAEKDRPRGLAYVIRQFRERGGIGGVELSPAVIRGLLSSNPEELLVQAWDGLMRTGPLSLLVEQYEELASASRRMAEVLGPEDVIALEQRTALADMGQYVAHRQILQMTARFEAFLPTRPVRPLVGRKEVPTRVHDEDQYPVGGYASLSNRGSIESLLHSQLAFMEERERPDLFDLKYIRDELFYYSRDENQFLRRRRAFAFVLFPDLLAARFKDPDLPTQRIVLLQSMLLAMVRRLSDWLSTDALRFEILFIQDGEKKGLTEEATLMTLLLRELIERGDAAVTWLPDASAAMKAIQNLSRTSQVHGFAASTKPPEFEVENTVITPMIVASPRPWIGDGAGGFAELIADEAFECWQETLLRLLELWV